MKKRVANESGAALVLALIAMVVLMILGTALLNLSLADNKFAFHQEDKNQAYYIARSGAQSVAEFLIQGEESDVIIGKTSTSYTLGEGSFVVDVYYPDPLDTTVIDINSVGTYNGIDQTVKIRVTETDPGKGMFDHTLYAFDTIDGGNLTKVVVDGTVTAGEEIDITLKNGSDIKTVDLIKYNEIPIIVPASYDWTGSITGDVTFNANTQKNINVSQINTNNNTITITGTGVVSMFITGNVDCTFKGNINISSTAQLHIYILKHPSSTPEAPNGIDFVFQGDPTINGKFFMYAPDANVIFDSATHIEFGGMIIANNITLHNQVTIETDVDSTIFNAITGIDTTNIGIKYRGYTWLQNN